MDMHGNYDIKIGKFANTATTAFAPLRASSFPSSGPIAGKSAYGRIGIKVGNPANTSGTASLVKFARFQHPQQPVENEDD